MSATNRGTERVEADFYPTPLSAFDPLITYIPEGGQIFDPAWGDSRLVKRMLEEGMDAWGSDLNDPENPVDFLTDRTRRYCIVTNPPFNLAMEFCVHALNQAEHTFMLLRLNFLASAKRKGWFMANEPNALFVLSERPGFVMSVSCAKKCGWKTLLPIDAPRPQQCPSCGEKVKCTCSDSCDYAWYYWGTSHRGIMHL